VEKGKLDEATDMAGDARLTGLLAEQGRDDFCKQVAAELDNQPDGQVNEGSGRLSLPYVFPQHDGQPGVL
jgi:hypothetical protein